jgi:hypothetical protein
MSSPFLLPNGWKIDRWIPDPPDTALPEGIPTDGVKEGGPLQITFDPTSHFHLDWLNQREENCLVSGLHSDLAETKLEGHNLTVNFGGRRVQCDLKVTLTQTAHPKQLSCRITLAELSSTGIFVDGPDTGGGTFTATANPGT